MLASIYVELLIRYEAETQEAEDTQPLFSGCFINLVEGHIVCILKIILNQNTRYWQLNSIIVHACERMKNKGVIRG